jgi:hypothetical protein
MRPERTGAADQGKPLKGMNLTGGTGLFTTVIANGPGIEGKTAKTCKRSGWLAERN